MCAHARLLDIAWLWYIPQVLEKRLRNRGTEDDESLATRLRNAREEIDYGNAEVRRC